MTSTTVTKKDLAQTVAISLGGPHQQRLPRVDRLFETLRETLIAGHRIELSGFGVLDVRATRPKPAARHPRTGEIV